MNPALILSLLQTVVSVGAALSNKPQKAEKINEVLTLISHAQLSFSQLVQALQASRKVDGSIDDAGWNAVHAYLDANRNKLEDALGIPRT
jgi:hypothetical protein